MTHTIDNFTTDRKIAAIKAVTLALQREQFRGFTEECKVQQVSLRHFHRWRADSSCAEVLELFDIAREQLAADYIEEARDILDNVQVGSRHAMAAVMKAKEQVSLRFRLAESLDPNNWSALRDEMKKISDELKIMKLTVEKYKR